MRRSGVTPPISGTTRAASSAFLCGTQSTPFSQPSSLDDFLLILKSVDVTDRSGGLGLDHLGPNLADRLKSVAQVEQFTAGLLDQFEARLKPAIKQELPGDEPFLSTLEGAGRRLLELVAPTDAPPLAIDAMLRLGVEPTLQTMAGPKE